MARRQQGGIRTRALLAAFGSNPLHMRSHADLVAIPIVAGHCAHRVRPVAVVVAGDERRGPAHVGRVEPAVVVVEIAGAEIASVLVDEGGMIELDTGVDAGDDDTFAAVAERRPHERRPDPIDAPLDPADLRLVHARNRRLESEDTVPDDPFDFRPAGELID